MTGTGDELGAGRPRASSSSLSAARTAASIAARLGAERRLEADRGDERVEPLPVGRAGVDAERRTGRDDVRRAGLDLEPADRRDRVRDRGRRLAHAQHELGRLARARRPRLHRRGAGVSGGALEDDLAAHEPGDAVTIAERRSARARAPDPARCAARGRPPAAAPRARAGCRPTAALLVAERDDRERARAPARSIASRPARTPSAPSNSRRAAPSRDASPSTRGHRCRRTCCRPHRPHVEACLLEPPAGELVRASSSGE